MLDTAPGHHAVDAVHVCRLDGSQALCMVSQHRNDCRRNLPRLANMLKFKRDERFMGSSTSALAPMVPLCKLPQNTNHTAQLSSVWAMDPYLTGWSYTPRQRLLFRSRLNRSKALISPDSDEPFFDWQLVLVSLQAVHINGSNLKINKPQLNLLT